MAPTITAATGLSQDHLSLSHKMRKPVVEKLRRERINSSIEQLKSLLCAEFLQQQPDSKLEKADVLEMTVTVLTCLQQQHKTHFLSQSLMKSSQQSHCTELHNHSSNCKDKSPVSSAPWRPW
ncbi:transcription factor HES-5-like [Boleophthalmus pectinirostris]|uniref:transcription factor HES-5-like n=1 Tax=Boleophthalmus pectinirostris TaxID=150288 RepID=UPI00242EAB8C|nr:transcription factor HES-5-like [Boleophthalmus pectinirostris]